MDNKTFKDILDTQLDVTTKMLASKNTEYAPGDVDVLHNFKQAAHVQENKPRQALAGMMVKHTISIYDMINGDTLFDDAKWDEKITDHINYLILLKAITSEENAEDLASLATLASEAVVTEQDDINSGRLIVEEATNRRYYKGVYVGAVVKQLNGSVDYFDTDGNRI